MKAQCSHCGHHYSLYGCLSDICPKCGAPPKRTDEGEIELSLEVFEQRAPAEVPATQYSTEEVPWPKVANG